MNVRPQQIAVSIALMDEGATVPFIARYRKEVTGGLDDTQLRGIEERLLYLRELEDRRVAILKSIFDQDKLTDALAKSIAAAETKQALEDLYLPYKPRRRTKAMIAREAGLEPLARSLMADPTLDPQVEAVKYINIDATAYAALSADQIKKSQAGEEGTHPYVPDVKTALDGARDILSEEFSETAPLLSKLREFLWTQGFMTSKVADGKEMAEEEKFRDYYAYSEPIRLVPSHRALALFRGRQLTVLQLKLSLEESQESLVPHPCEVMIAKHVGIESLGRPADKWLAEVCRWTWRVKTSLSLEMALFTQLREAAETEAIKVFARNLHELLLAAPAGPKVVMGVDPGIRTGCKVAVVDATGKLLETSTIYPHEPRKDWDGSLAVLGALCVKHQVSLVAIGNGTASRETDRLVKDLMKLLSAKQGSDAHPLQKIVVSEAGASVYSASELAALEFPELDVSLRGAVSIARRLQDPLAELVKIEPKAIGVGQYQHDVNQFQLSRTLDAVVEDCVNAVGVDLNTASVPLLSKVSGLNAGLARNIVSFRDTKGRFNNREALKEVPRLGDKAFEQAAGFLRISGGDNPLDQSSVHPESYPLVEKILKQLGQPVTEVIGNKELIKQVAANDVIKKLVDDKFGVVTIKDILAELEKPGRDPRPEFKTATFEDGVEDINQLIPGMILEGVVTNVAAFGAFIDIGVHQDGLVHVSALADKFVKDPHEVVKAGQVVKVKVLEVDVKRRRIGLTMKLNDSAPSSSNSSASSSRSEAGDRSQARSSKPSHQAQSRSQAPQGNTAFAEAFAKLKAKN
ncbi:RNA-binding transcriptional accessory protein [Polynucleobacter sp. 30F-ANTBAC]|uniref:Tex family protein n=1 Tax=Polynucleobacter sp. 30F-ANTBAC TaxID=2689095 RepID=UPI001C0B7836|nr:Tex family protein [Polynucleobacter sp. 30F-ANTBAC]MBU3599623.1 RNA-binding transcriptional accessory protein [Polynucleobacter sp. 30F-ANTBAC]